MNINVQNSSPQFDLLKNGYLCSLNEVGLLICEGEDSLDFLNRQFTQNVLHLSEQESMLSGYCSPKGRLLADMLIWRYQGKVFLNCSVQLQAGLQKRLSMFVLRANVKLFDARANYFQLILGGGNASKVLKNELGINLGSINEKADFSFGCVIRLPDAGQGFGERYLLVADRLNESLLLPKLTSELMKVPECVTQLAEIHTGIARITAATYEQFVPQMLNFELIGAVNFKKGCYPGQEIVARSQYLGKIKRRTFIAHVDAQALPGMEVFTTSDPEQACGMIVNAAPHPNGGSDCLVEVKLQAYETKDVRLNSLNGENLKFLDMPYALPEYNQKQNEQQ